MSADGKHCECGNAAVATLRVAGVREPICGPCLARIAPAKGKGS